MYANGVVSKLTGLFLFVLALMILLSIPAYADGPGVVYPNEYYIQQNYTNGNGWTHWAETDSEGIYYYWQCPRYDSCGNPVYTAPDLDVRRHEMRHWYRGYNLRWGEWNRRYRTPVGKCLEEVYAGGGYTLNVCGEFVDPRW